MTPTEHAAQGDAKVREAAAFLLKFADQIKDLPVPHRGVVADAIGLVVAQVAPDLVPANAPRPTAGWCQVTSPPEAT